MNETRIVPGFDRTTEDVGNIVELGHVNTRIPDQQLATIFYVSGLGLTRDPYLMTGIDNMWVNVGRSQFHLPTGSPQVVAGVTGLVIAGREALLRRLAAVRPFLGETMFRFAEHEDHVEAVSPWGNRFRVHEPAPGFCNGAILAMPYVEFEAPVGTLDGMRRFYNEAIGARAEIADGALRVTVSSDQHLVYRESDAVPAAYDGNHVQITLNDFSGPHRWLAARGLITQESDQHQYRFQDLVDPDTGKVLFTVEHETRSMRHPLFSRVLVNRNPNLTQRGYKPGQDAWAWQAH
jgi:hypothetical protein